MPPIRPFEQIDAGGVDARSNPINMPRNRALRCLNWVPKQAGFWELRWGYSSVSMSTVSNAAIHSMFPYRTWDGNKYVLFMQGTTLNVFNTATGTVTTPTVRGSAVSSTAKGAGYFANNRFHYGNGTDQKWFDGATWRDNGLRSLTAAEVVAVSITEGVRELTTAQAAAVTLTPAAGGSFPADILTGRLMYVAIFDISANEIGPATIFVGAGRVKLTLNQKVTVGSLPNLSGVNTNWVKLIGGTGDGQNVAGFYTNTLTTITNIVLGAGVGTITAVAHGLSTNDVVILGATSILDGLYAVTVTGVDTFTIVTSATGTPANGTVKRVVAAGNATTSVDVLAPTQDQNYQVNQNRGLAPSAVGGPNPGYQFYACFYNPTGGGHVGNRTLIGGRALQTGYRSNWRVAGFTLGNLVGNILTVQLKNSGPLFGLEVILTLDRNVDPSLNATNLLLTGLTTANFLNGLSVFVIGISGSRITATVNITHANYGPASDTGSVTTVSTSLDTELTILIGRTGDGALVPYPCVDNAVNWTFIPNGQSSITITQPGLDSNELPYRNGIIPAQCNMFCVAGDFCYAADPNSATVRRSGSLLDDRAGLFVGRPEQSWAPNDIDTFPTGEACTAIFEVDQEVLVGTINDSALSVNLAGVQQWVGPFNIGIAGRRAGTKCGSHGFFWLTGEKQLATIANGTPVSISDEYELAELAQIGDANLSTVELIYYRNAAQGKDELRIEALDSNNNPYTIIHDFKLREFMQAPGSIYGQGYASTFLGQLASSFTAAQIRDGNGKLQVFAGGTNGQIYQLYSGADDMGNQYAADMILLINGGTNRPSVPWVDWYGDPNIVVSVGKTLSTSLSPGEFMFEALPEAQSVPGAENDFLYRAYLTTPEIQHIFVRFQLNAHSVDGNLNLSSPPHIPLESYGRLYELIPAVGDERER